MIYSIVAFLIYAIAYTVLGMEDHFNVGDTKVSNVEHAVYHSWCVQATCMDEITPKTRAGRILQATQASVAWLPMIILLSPWNIVA